MIGAFAALPAEARCLAGRRCAAGELLQLSQELMLLVGGMGAAAADGGAERLVNGGATALLSWGSAAGLAPGVTPGCILVPDIVIGSGAEQYHSDAAWQTRLRAALQSSHIRFLDRPLAESASVLRTPGEKQRLHEATGAVAADMESAAVARVAQRHRLPFLCLRATADTATASVPPALLAVLDNFGRPRPAGLIRALLRQPNLIPELIHLGRSFRAASNSLRAIARAAAGPLGLAPDPDRS